MCDSAMAEAIEIILNGNRTSIPRHWTVYDLVTDLGLEPEQIAVEINQEIVKRPEWVRREIEKGDLVEFAHFVGGGEKKEHVR